MDVGINKTWHYELIWLGLINLEITRWLFLANVGNLTINNRQVMVLKNLNFAINSIDECTVEEFGHSRN